MIKERSKSLCARETKDSVVSLSENPRPRRKSTHSIPMRSRSLVDYSSIQSRGPRFYYPTQDDIYRILDETSQAARPSTGSKRLSPYTPLPAIGTRINTPESKDEKSDGETPPPIWESHDISSGGITYRTNILESKTETNLGDTPPPIWEGRNILSIGSPLSRTNKVVANDGDTPPPIWGSPDTTVNTSPVPRLVREGTYDVLEPKFVRGPTPLPQSPSMLINTELQKSRKKSEKSKKKKSSDAKTDKRKFKDPFKESSGTVLFGARVPALCLDGDLEDVWEESESCTKSPSLPLEGVEDNANFISTDNTMQKLYSQRNHWLSSAVSNVTIPANKEHAPRIQQTFWFD